MFQLLVLDVVAEEVAGRPGNAIDAAPFRVHGERDDPFSFWSRAELFELAGGEIVAEYVAALIRPVTGRGIADELFTAFPLVVADVGGEVELALVFEEADVALALRNRFQALLSRGLRQVADVLDFLGARIEDEHLGPGVQRLGGQYVVDPAVARGGDAVVV